MFALVVLFTIFVGLVGLLAVIGECQKRRHSSAEKRREREMRETLARVKGWLSGRGLDVPSVDQVMTLLNSSLQQAPSKVRKRVSIMGVGMQGGWVIVQLIYTMEWQITPRYCIVIRP
jgi:hypothetical protein